MVWVWAMGIKSRVGGGGGRRVRTFTAAEAWPVGLRSEDMFAAVGGAGLGEGSAVGFGGYMW